MVWTQAPGIKENCFTDSILGLDIKLPFGFYFETLNINELVPRGCECLTNSFFIPL